MDIDLELTAFVYVWLRDMLVYTLINWFSFLLSFEGSYRWQNIEQALTLLYFCSIPLSFLDNFKSFHNLRVMSGRSHRAGQPILGHSYFLSTGDGDINRSGVMGP